MNFDDIRRIFERSVLLSLDHIITPRLVTLAYFLGLASILLWSISHLVGTFSLGFAEGIWGLLEIGVFGAAALIALRVTCEVLIVYFRSQGVATDTSNSAGTTASLIDEVKDAIEDLAGDVESEIESTPPKATAAKPAPKKSAAKTSTSRSAAAKKPAAPAKPATSARRATTARTAKRSAPKKPAS